MLFKPELNETAKAAGKGVVRGVLRRIVSITVTPSLPNTSTLSAPLAAAALTRTICCYGRLNCTVIGCNWVMMTSPVASAAWMMLPWSTWRRPARPEIGATILV